MVQIRLRNTDLRNVFPTTLEPTAKHYSQYLGLKLLVATKFFNLSVWPCFYFTHLKYLREAGERYVQ